MQPATHFPLCTGPPSWFSQAVIGTIVNVGGIVVGGFAGLIWRKPMSATSQNFLKVVLGLVTVFCGLRLTWLSLGGPFLTVLKQIAVVTAALVAGRITGRLLRLQKVSNRVGRFARERIAVAKPGGPSRLADGFEICAALFCAAPLGILGAIHDGLSGYYWPLVVKAAMDGLAVLGFVSMLGPGVILSAVPVLVFQGTISLVCERFLGPFLQARHLVEPVNATGGLLIFCVALIIFDFKKIQVTDYLPSLAFAPLFTALLLH